MSDRAVELYDRVVESEGDLSASDALDEIRQIRRELDLDPEELPSPGDPGEFTDGEESSP
ncbi:MAG: hypothetical protein ABEI99_06270 [Halobaculum sp.]